MSTHVLLHNMCKHTVMEWRKQLMLQLSKIPWVGVWYSSKCIEDKLPTLLSPNPLSFQHRKQGDMIRRQRMCWMRAGEDCIPSPGQFQDFSESESWMLTRNWGWITSTSTRFRRQFDRLQWLGIVEFGSECYVTEGDIQFRHEENLVISIHDFAASALEVGKTIWSVQLLN
jgi:hypothetical protein